MSERNTTSITVEALRGYARDERNFFGTIGQDYPADVKSDRLRNADTLDELATSLTRDGLIFVVMEGDDPWDIEANPFPDPLSAVTAAMDAKRSDPEFTWSIRVEVKS